MRIPLRSGSVLGLGLLIGLLGAGAADEPAPAVETNYRVISGEVTTERGELLVKGRSAVLVIGEEKLPVYRVAAEVKLNLPTKGKAGEALVVALPVDPKQPTGSGAGKIAIRREKAGHVLRIGATAPDAKNKDQWAAAVETAVLTFWPPSKKKAAKLAKTDTPERSWHDRWLPLRVDVGEHAVMVWLDGQLLHEFDRPAGAAKGVGLQLIQGDRLRGIRAETLNGPDVFVPIDLAGEANARFDQPIGKRRVDLGGVPFELLAGPADHLNLLSAEWKGWKQDLPWSHENAVPAFLHDPRMPVMCGFRWADYTAAHVLAVADDEPKHAAAFTLRTGPLYVKMGMRYGMFGASAAARKKYGILKGNEPAIQGGIGGYEKVLAQHPDTPPAVLLFHETSISGRHITRAPDLFHDRAIRDILDFAGTGWRGSRPFARVDSFVAQSWPARHPLAGVKAAARCSVPVGAREARRCVRGAGRPVLSRFAG